jgi:hypothetical protein
VSLPLRSLLRVLAVQAVLGLGVGACAAIVGLKDGIPEDEAGAEGGGGVDATTDGAAAPDGPGADGSATDGADGSPADATADGGSAVDSSDSSADSGTANDSGDAGQGTDTGGADSGSADSGACSSQVVDAMNGIFVTRTGSSAGATCGTIATPCAAVQLGIDRASALGRSTVYVASGTYTESVNLAGGVTVQGGWSASGTAWTPICTGNPAQAQAVTIVAPASANVTAAATNLGGTATLQTLTIQSKAQSSVKPGESVYGIVATGASTQLVLDDVYVTAAAGGGGATGTAGDAGAPATGTCAAGTGMTGTAGPSGPGADGGTFSSAGYSGGNGSAATAGGPGNNGTVGGPPVCADCVTTTSCPALSCTIGSTMHQCGTEGVSGCGGLGGGAGSGGGGGGSSIALFVWDAHVSCNGGGLTAGSGGAGGGGGLGGDGGAGTSGQAGMTTGMCGTSVGGVCATGCSITSPVTLSGGDAGGAGGTGGTGGQGGGGAGGWSCAYYQGGAGLVTLSSISNTAHGNPGTGGPPGGASGAAKDRCP